MATYDDTSASRNIKNSIGNITYCKFRDLNVLKGKVMKNQSNTLAQQMQRKRFPEYIEIAYLCSEASEVGFPGRPRRHSPDNAFVKANKGNVTVNEDLEVSVDYTKLVCSAGMLKEPRVTATVDPETGTLTFTMKETALYGKRCAKTDLVYALIIEKAQHESIFSKLGTREGTTQATVSIPGEWARDELEVYVFVTSANGRQASKTVYVIPA